MITWCTRPDKRRSISRGLRRRLRPWRGSRRRSSPSCRRRAPTARRRAPPAPSRARSARRTRPASRPASGVSSTSAGRTSSASPTRSSSSRRRGDADARTSGTLTRGGLIDLTAAVSNLSATEMPSTNRVLPFSSPRVHCMSRRRASTMSLTSVPSPSMQTSTALIVVVRVRVAERLEAVAVDVDVGRAAARVLLLDRLLGLRQREQRAEEVRERRVEQRVLRE